MAKESHNGVDGGMLKSCLCTLLQGQWVSDVVVVVGETRLPRRLTSTVVFVP